MREGYKMTELGEIPNNWKVANLGDIASFSQGIQVDVSKQFTEPKENHVRFIRIIDYTQNNSDRRYVPNFGDRYYAKPEDIVMIRYGTPGIIGRRIEGIIANNMFKINFQNGIDNNFAEQYFKYPDTYRRIINGSGSSTMPAINFSFLRSFKVIVPTLSEQNKIAEILSTVDEKIDVIEEQIKETEALKKGLMQKLLTKGIGHTKFKDSPLGEIPESWEVIKIDDLLESKRIISHLDGNHGELYPKANEFTEDGIPYISANCFANGKVDFSLCKKLPENRAALFRKGVAKDGDILFAHNATVGPVAYLKTNLEYVILSTTATYYRLDNKTIDSKYWMYYLASNYFINQYSKVMGQSTRNQVPITMQRSFLSILPEFNEQIKIGKILTTVDEKLEVLLLRKNNFQELKKGLMQQLLTGKIRVSLN